MTQTIRIMKTSITDAPADVIVNAANSHLQHGSGVCGAIFRAAGARELQQACDELGGCPTGSAVITPGFALCPYIVHAVGPIWRGGSHGEPAQLFSCYQRSLDLAKEKGCHTIAFPLISAGIYGYPVPAAWRTALKSVTAWLETSPDCDMEILFAVLDEGVLREGRNAAQELGIALLETGD